MRFTLVRLLVNCDRGRIGAVVLMPAYLADIWVEAGKAEWPELARQTLGEPPVQSTVEVAG